MTILSGTCWLSVVLLTASASAAQQDLALVQTESTNEAVARSVVATVNQEPVYIEHVERVLESLHYGRTEEQRSSPDKDLLLSRLINDQLLAQEALALGLQDEEPIPAALKKYRLDLAAEQLESEEIWSRAEPSQDEIEKAFEDLYRQVTFRTITVKEGREEAEKLLEEIKKGADFSELAREESIDQFGPRGGLVEDLDRIDMPKELAAEAFSMAPGELAGPIPTRLGWSILKIEGFQEADPTRLPRLRAKIRSILRLQEAEALKTDFAAGLRENHRVVIADDALAAISSERQPDGRIFPKLDDPDLVITKVGDRSITGREVEKELRSRWVGVTNPEVAEAMKPLVLESLIGGELIRAEAIRRKYDRLPEVERAVASLETELLVSKYLREVLRPSVNVGPAEIQDYYDAHKAEFHRPPRVKLGQITVDSEELSLELAELLRQGADLAWLARQHSIDGYRDQGGARGWLSPGEVGISELDEALFEAPAGAVLGPAEMGPRFTVVVVEARKEEGIYPLEEISGNVRQVVWSERFRQRLHEALLLLKNESEITVNDELMSSLLMSTSATRENSTNGASAAH